MHCKGAVITLEDSVKWGWQNEHFEHLDWCYSSVCGQSLLGWLWCGPGATEGAGRLWNLSFRRYLSIFSPIESEKNAPSFRFPTVQRCPAALLSFKRSTKCAFVLAWILHPILNFSNVLPFCFRCISIFSWFLILKDWKSSISTQSGLLDLQWICRAWTCRMFFDQSHVASVLCRSISSPKRQSQVTHRVAGETPLGVLPPTRCSVGSPHCAPDSKLVRRHMSHAMNEWGGHKYFCRQVTVCIYIYIVCIYIYYVWSCIVYVYLGSLLYYVAYV